MQQEAGNLDATPEFRSPATHKIYKGKITRKMFVKYADVFVKVYHGVILEVSCNYSSIVQIFHIVLNEFDNFHLHRLCILFLEFVINIVLR